MSDATPEFRRSRDATRSALPGSRTRAAGITLLAGATGIAGLYLFRKARSVRLVDASLRYPGLWMSQPVNPLSLPLMRTSISLTARIDVPAGITASERQVPGPPGAPDVRVVIFQRAGHAPASPAMLWIHGGGYVLGTPEMDSPLLSRMLDQIDMTIVAVDYRLAPEHPFPAGLDDCAAALRWLVDQAGPLGIDSARIAIAGASAGGGLAAALAQRVADEGPVTPVMQLLVYPMLDDRTLAPKPSPGQGEFGWTPASNRFGWGAYLGHEPGTTETRMHAVPARRTSLAGLPPAWIGVGTLDLFHDEDLAYAARLRADGVACEVEIVDGAYHGFDVMRFDAPPSVAFHQRMIEALRHRFAAGRGADATAVPA